MDTLQLFHAGMFSELRTWVGFLLLTATGFAGWYSGGVLFAYFEKRATDK